jgi:hypothetical protein
MTEEPQTDLTALMSLDPLDLTKQDLDRIIAHQRKQRVAREGGAKTKKATGETPAVDIKALMGKIAVSAKAPAPIPSAPSPKPAPAKGFIRRF